MRARLTLHGPKPMVRAVSAGAGEALGGVRDSLPFRPNGPDLVDDTMAEDRDRLPSLDDLADRTRRLRETISPGSKSSGPGGAGGSSGAAQGLRIAVELVAAVAIGTGIGWFLDSWLGTKPVLFLVFFLLGTVAGFLNVYRTAKEMDARAARERAEAQAEETKGPASPDGGGPGTKNG